MSSIKTNEDMREAFHILNQISEVLSITSEIGHSSQNRAPQLSDIMYAQRESLMQYRDSLQASIRTQIKNEFDVRLHNCADVHMLRELWEDITKQLPF